MFFTYRRHLVLAFFVFGVASILLRSGLQAQESAPNTNNSTTQTEASASAQVPTPAIGVSREVFDEWNLICTALVADNPTRSCHISTKFQVEKDAGEDTKKDETKSEDKVTEEADEKDAEPKGPTETVLLLSVLKKAGQKEPVAIFSMPLGIYLPTGLTIQVDKKTPYRVAVETCNPTGCHAGIKLNSRRLNQFKRGNTAFVYFQDGNQNTLKLPLSLIGFTKATEALLKSSSSAKK